VPDPDTNDQPSGLAGYLRRALGHAMEALRCYAALLAADAEERLNRSTRSAIGAVAWVAFGAIGLVYFAGGLVEFLDTHIGERVPGGGRMLVGGVILAAFLIVLAVERSGEKK